MVHRALSLLAGATLGATLIAAPSASAQSTTHVDQVSQSFDIVQFRSHEHTTAAVSAPVAQAWAVLPGVFAELGMSVVSLDSAQHGIIAERARLRRSLGGERVSRYLDCGQRLGVSNADSYIIWLQVVAQVDSSSAGVSQLNIDVRGKGQPVGSSENPVECTTTGRLEDRIVQEVAAKTH